MHFTPGTINVIYFFMYLHLYAPIDPQPSRSHHLESNKAVR